MSGEALSQAPRSRPSQICPHKQTLAHISPPRKQTRRALTPGNPSLFPHCAQNNLPVAKAGGEIEELH